METWKEIKGYEGLYQISSIGRVKRDNRILKPTVQKSGYYIIYLSKLNNPVRVYVHKLVADAFIANDDCKPQVNHINGIKLDNRIENLEWVTQRENSIHAMKNGLHPVKYEKVMTKERTDRVFELYSLGSTQKEIGRILDVHQSVISRVLNKKRQYILIT